MTNDRYRTSEVLSVIIALITGFMTLIAAIPNIQAVLQVKVIGKLIFDVIDRTPELKETPG